jgi:hypothetical protein
MNETVEIPASYHDCVKNLIEAAGTTLTADQTDMIQKRYTPIYFEYLTEEDFNGMRDFVLTPLGQKLIKVCPEMGTRLFSEFMRTNMSPVMREATECKH